MTTDGWTGRITVRRPDGPSADRLTRALAPEATREVPRARAILERGPGASVILSIDARDTGALRAALNTYLGWIDLANRTESVAAGSATAHDDPLGADDVPKRL